jgi:hypothetical protein
MTRDSFHRRFLSVAERQTASHPLASLARAGYAQASSTRVHQSMRVDATADSFL